MGRNEVQAAVSQVVADGRAAKLAGDQALADITTALTAAIAVKALMSVNTVSQQNLDDLTAALAAAEVGRVAAGAALASWWASLTTNNAALRNE